MSQFSFDIDFNLTVDDVVELFSYRVVNSSPDKSYFHDFPVTNFSRALESYARCRYATMQLPAGSSVSLQLVSKDAPMFSVTLFEYVR